MRLKPEQLDAHLKKSLAPVYLVSGDEPLQLMETCDAIRAAAREQGYSERRVFEVERGFDWNSLTQEAQAMSLFAEKRLLELRLNAGPGNDGGPVLIEYCERPPEDNVLLISTARLDRRSQQAKWFKAVDKAGVAISVWPVEAGRLPEWINRRCRSRGLEIDPEAAELIAQRVEGNLLAAAQEIEKLRLLTEQGRRIDVDAVLAAVADSARYDAFVLIASACAGDLARALRMLRGLRDEGAEAIAIHGALMWQLRRACTLARERAGGEPEAEVFRRHHVYDKQQTPLKHLFRRHTPAALEHLLRTGGRIDAQLKGYAEPADPGDPWQSLGWLLARLAGYDSLPASIAEQ